jgi:hypothetical protein
MQAARRHGHVFLVMTARSRRSIMAMPPGFGLPLPRFQRGRWPSLRGRRGSFVRGLVTNQNNRPSAGPPPAVEDSSHLPRQGGGGEGLFPPPVLPGRWRERLRPPSETTPEQGVGPLGRPIALFRRKSGLSGSGRGSGGFSIPCLGVSGALMRRKRALFCRRSARFCHGSALMRGTSALFWFPRALFCRAREPRHRANGPGHSPMGTPRDASPS